LQDKEALRENNTTKTIVTPHNQAKDTEYLAHTNNLYYGEIKMALMGVLPPSLANHFAFVEFPNGFVVGHNKLKLPEVFKKLEDTNFGIMMQLLWTGDTMMAMAEYSLKQKFNSIRTLIVGDTKYNELNECDPRKADYLSSQTKPIPTGNIVEKFGIPVAMRVASRISAQAERYARRIYGTNSQFMQNVGFVLSKRSSSSNFPGITSQDNRDALVAVDSTTQADKLNKLRETFIADLLMDRRLYSNQQKGVPEKHGLYKSMYSLLGIPHCEVDQFESIAHRHTTKTTRKDNLIQLLEVFDTSTDITTALENRGFFDQEMRSKFKPRESYKVTKSPDGYQLHTYQNGKSVHIDNLPLTMILSHLAQTTACTVAASYNNLNFGNALNNKPFVSDRFINQYVVSLEDSN
jgi:hypothetical protein